MGKLRPEACLLFIHSINICECLPSTSSGCCGRGMHAQWEQAWIPLPSQEAPGTSHSTLIDLSVWDGRSLENTVSHCLLVQLPQPWAGCGPGYRADSRPRCPRGQPCGLRAGHPDFCFSVPACPREAHPLLSPLPDKASSFLGQPETSVAHHKARQQDPSRCVTGV